jgi:4-amino-4-deoxy-L-arabinose transferase-like glycosyltransferase
MIMAAALRGLNLPRALWVILGASIAGRVIFAAITPILTDEAYAIAVGRSFSLSFFDHPPLGFWLPAIAERLGAHSALAYRVPSLVLGTVSTGLLFLIGRDLGGACAGLWSAGLGALTPTLAFAGTFILPDAPLDVFTLATVLVLLRIATSDRPPLRLWIVGGVTLALAFCSKYQAGLIPISVLIWMVSTQKGRKWFATRGFYLAVGISLLGLMPVIVWNMSHDWASFRFQSGRADNGLSSTNFAVMALGQTLFLLPLVLVWSIRELISRANWTRPERRLLVLIAIGPIVMFNLIYLLSRGTLPHWSMPGWICLIPLVAARLSDAAPHPGRTWNFVTAAGLYAGLLILATHLATGWLVRFPNHDPAWDQTAPNVSLSALRATLLRSGVLTGADVLVTENWIQAGYMSAALGDRIPVRVISGAAHHFAYLAGADASGSGVLLGIADASDAADRQKTLIALARQLDPDAFAAEQIPLRRGAQDHFRIIAIRLRIPPGG